MMSNRSSFSIGRYLSYQLKRFNYLIIIFSLIGLLIGPLISYLALDTSFKFSQKITPALIHNKIFSYMMGAGALSIYFLAGLLGIVFALIFSYFLQSKKVTNFYHALPIRREAWLFSQYLLGFSIFTIINLITFIGNIGVLCYLGGVSNVPWLIIGVHFLQSELFFLCSFALSMLAGQLTGNILGHLGMIAVIQFGVSTLGALIYGMMSIFYKTFVNSQTILDMMSLSLPVAYFRYITNLKEAGLFSSSEVNEVVNFNLPYMGHMMIGLLLLFSCLAVILSFIAYKKRPLERASETLIFKGLNLPLKFYLGLIESLAFGLLLYGISNKIIFLYLGIILGLIVYHIFYEMAVRRDVRAILKPMHWLSTVVIAVLIILFAMTFSMDIFGYDDYKPKEESVLNVKIKNYMNDSDILSDVYLSKPENIKAALELAQLGIENIDNYEGYKIAPDKNRWIEFNVSYNLVEGAKVERVYNVPVVKFEEIYKNIFNSKEYRNANKENYNEKLNKLSNLTFYDDYLGFEVLTLKASEKEKMEAFKTAFLSDIENRSLEETKGTIVATAQYQIEVNNYPQTNQLYIYETDKASIALLKNMEAQKAVKAGRSFYFDTLPNFKKLEISSFDEKDKINKVRKVITDKKEIEDYIKNRTVGVDANNNLENIDYRFEVIPYLADSNDSGKSRNFKKNMIPKDLV